MGRDGEHKWFCFKEKRQNYARGIAEQFMTALHRYKPRESYGIYEEERDNTTKITIKDTTNLFKPKSIFEVSLNCLGPKKPRLKGGIKTAKKLQDVLRTSDISDTELKQVYNKYLKKKFK